MMQFTKRKTHPLLSNKRKKKCVFGLIKNPNRLVQIKMVVEAVEMVRINKHQTSHQIQIVKRARRI